MALWNRLVPRSVGPGWRGPVSVQLTLTLAEYLSIQSKSGEQGQRVTVYDQDVDNLISYCQSETDLWLISSQINVSRKKDNEVGDTLLAC